MLTSVEDIRKKKNRDYMRKYQAQMKQSLKNQQPDTFMTTRSESHTSANKKVESSRLKHLHVTVQESSQKAGANDAELSTSDDQNRQRKQQDYMTNYRAKRLAVVHMDKQTQNTTVRDSEITIRHQTAHMVNNAN